MHESTLESKATKLAIETFGEKFKTKPTLLARAPVRVNLIGEHTDYNQGFVLPVAINRQMLIAAKPNDAAMVSVNSNEYDSFDNFSLNSAITKNPGNPWSNYLRATLDTLQRDGHKLREFEAVLVGTVPQGAGLSSSAAYEVAVAMLANHMNNLSLTLKEIASTTDNDDSKQKLVISGFAPTINDTRRLECSYYKVDRNGAT